MTLISRVSPWLAATLLCALLAPLCARSDDGALRIALRPAGVATTATPDLVARLDRWLDRRIAWPARDTPPRIRYITPRRAAQLNGQSDRGHGRTCGLYDAESGTIYLVTPWSADTPEDVAVLLHELVHHRQAPHHFYCGPAREPAAYKAQSDWLVERGLKPDVNWLAVVWNAGCTPRDIHPD